MTHKPPVPEANLSPYPTLEAPHQSPEQSYEVAAESYEGDESLLDTIRDQIKLDGRQLAGIVAAVGLGAVAAGSAIFFARRDKQTKSKPGARKAKSRKTTDA